MVYGEGSEEPLFHLQEMIMANNQDERKTALDSLFPFMKNDIKETLRAMKGLPVTIRLMDHHFMNLFHTMLKDRRSSLML